MLSRSTLFLRELTRKTSYRNLSFKQLNENKSIITRHLAWFSGQRVNQTFGS
jgi:hypothetical protein